LAKRLSEKQKKEIIELFKSGFNIDDLSNQFYCNKITISRNLKKSLGEEKYKELFIKSKSKNKLIKNKNKNINFSKEITADSSIKNNANINKSRFSLEEESFISSQFIEVAPLNCSLDSASQKDLTSVPINEVDLPKTVYMIVDKKIELKIKYLKDYPKWNFLSEDELERKTIEIFFEMKTAKSFCDKEQKVIKVPNTHVFKIASSFLTSRGITRIVSSDTLIAL
tara:strand:+ start:6224 stop:6898 length:675 start_codon:yes stop_codon:yes gene_type:complete